ncbi:pirin family protein [Pseudomonas capeferrum]|uniref:pirin family protein n=1 Tax=Pseudomonas capeferrum TaxID=1495066 RepID=UPI0015E45ECD|nr:pirin family protein [Pseudomonas capeferrum]MBA1203199.1 pirin family protein [Pseudomonas capeferrum]
MTYRTVIDQHPAHRDDISDLVTRRPLPGPTLPHLDPFLFLNHHGPQFYPPHNAGLPFGPHPHRGFETVTFILDGELAHHDSGNHESVIHAGGVQWMTAGSGLVHSELSPQSFKNSGGRLEILQLWINLPARLKMTTPAYTGLQREDIAHVRSEGVCVGVVSGMYESVQGALRSLTDVCMLTVDLASGATIDLPAPVGHTVFCYMVKGQAQAAGTTLLEHHLVQLSDDGDQLRITAETATTLLYGHAAPFKEAIVSYGPFVMNTREEIQQAIEDYQNGRF